MELFVFARFHARQGHEKEVAAALRNVVGPSRAEPGCLFIQAYRSVREPLLFYVHSRWKDEPAFDIHASLPHTQRFVQQVEPLIDHPLEVARMRALEALPIAG
jgi:quinol monooxygenase YgiN